MDLHDEVRLDLDCYKNSIYLSLHPSSTQASEEDFEPRTSTRINSGTRMRILLRRGEGAAMPALYFLPPVPAQEFSHAPPSVSFPTRLG